MTSAECIIVDSVAIKSVTSGTSPAEVSASRHGTVLVEPPTSAGVVVTMNSIE